MNHPDVDLIAFTGSRDVGLLINRQAAETRPGQDHVKRVIAEMGGKNAIIVDDDADLDEAVVGVLAERLRLRRPEVLGLLAGDRAGGDLRRLPRPAGRGGPSRRRSARPTIPRPLVGPVIDAEARERIEEYQRDRRDRGPRRRSTSTSARWPSAGYFVGPHDRRRRPARRPDRPGGDLRPGAGRHQGEATSTTPCESPTARSTP